MHSKNEKNRRHMNSDFLATDDTDKSVGNLSDASSRQPVLSITNRQHVNGFLQDFTSLCQLPSRQISRKLITQKQQKLGKD